VSWQTEAVADLRTLLRDDNPSAQRYTDAQLQGLWVSAARQVLTDCLAAGFLHAYAVSTAAVSVAPDPTGAGTADPDFVALVSLKAACIAAQGEAAKGAGQAIAIGSNGGDKIDLRDTWRARDSLLKSGPCQGYALARTAYVNKVAGGLLGRAVGTPIRFW
jgi:hypothetical protein